MNSPIHFNIFFTVIGTQLRTDMVEFWFLMQIALIFGLPASYPINW
ncbi:MAG: DUF4396 domain-containing protein [Acetobacteraceae bacterium]